MYYGLFSLLKFFDIYLLLLQDNLVYEKKKSSTSIYVSTIVTKTRKPPGGTSPL